MEVVAQQIAQTQALGIGQVVAALEQAPAGSLQDGRLLELLDDDEGAPLIHPPLTEHEQRSVDSTGRKLNAFMRSTPPVTG